MELPVFECFTKSTSKRAGGGGSHLRHQALWAHGVGRHRHLTARGDAILDVRACDGRPPDCRADVYRSSRRAPRAARGSDRERLWRRRGSVLYRGEGERARRQGKIRWHVAAATRRAAPAARSSGQTRASRRQAADERKHLVTPILSTRPEAESPVIVVSLPIACSHGASEESKAARFRDKYPTRPGIVARRRQRSDPFPTV